MGAELMQASKVFKKSISACAGVLKPLDIDLHQEFSRPGGRHEPANALVSLTALQVRALASLRMLETVCTSDSWVVVVSQQVS
jgi:hypothetical protein